MAHWRHRQPISAPTFDDAVPPPGYIPGYGRGAIGFGTRATAGVVPGYTYTKEDDEADSVFDQIDAKMKSRKRKKKKDEKADDKSKKQKNDSVHDQFKDLKAEMSTVTWDEWDAIPDIGDTTVKHHKPERFMPVPEKLILEKVADSKPVLSGVHGLWDVRGQMLENKLDDVKASGSGASSSKAKDNGVNESDYLNDLEKSLSRNVGDIKKARQLFTSVRQSNPSYAAGWVAAARLEESAGKIMAAKQIMQDACVQCPKHEDIWIEAARLEQKHNAKVLLAKGAKHVPSSELIWLKAHELEDTTEQKKTVLRKGLENAPKSEKLWKALVDLEENQRDCKIILASAVECVPQAVELWLKLASLSEFERARKVLNKARSKVPNEIRIYISAAHLEEKHSNPERVEKIIRKAYKTIMRQSSDPTGNGPSKMNLEEWFKLAESSEKKDGKPLTAGSIIRASIDSLAGSSEGGKRNWLDMVDTFVKNDAPFCAKALLSFVLAREENASEEIWIRAAEMEEDIEKAKQLLIKKVKASPRSLLLWKKLVEYEKKSIAGSNETKDLLLHILSTNPDISIRHILWLLAVDLAISRQEEMAIIDDIYDKAKKNAPANENLYITVALHFSRLGRADRARSILEEGRNNTGENGGNVWVTSVRLEMGDLNASIKNFGSSSTDENVAKNIISMCQKGLKQCPDTPELYSILSKYEAKVSVAKARSTLELGRIRCPSSDQLWMSSIQLERKSGNENLAKNMMAKALQACPTSGVLYADEIINAPKVRRKGVAFEALKRCKDDIHVMTAVAKMFYDTLMYGKARKWLDRVAALNQQFFGADGLAQELNSLLKDKNY